MKNLLKDSKAYHEDNAYYEIFSQAEDSECKVARYLYNISREKIVLDAGCGTGKFLRELEKNSKEYIGIDLSSDQLEKARLKSLKDTSQFMCSNLSSLPLDDNTIDLVVSSWVLGTITNIEERIKALKELKRVLKSGSIVLVENAEYSEFEIIRGRDKDTRTRDYNDWILYNGFMLDEEVDTCFSFKTLEEARKCFEVIYGSEVASRVKDSRIGHKINIYKYNKS